MHTKSLCPKVSLPVALAVAGALPLLLLPAVQVLAQSPDTFFVPGRNVNTVGPIPPGPNPYFIGNPTFKQRNEVSCDVSPNSWLVVLCANNHYGGVPQFGDSWIGLTMSTDGGLTWRSRLLDGFPATNTGVGAADPVARTVPGLGIINYITINRADGRGTLAVAVLLERNKENGEPYQFYRTYVVGTGTPGRFNDKPAMTVMLDPAGGTLDIGGRKVPKGTIHVVYSLFPGNDNNSSSEIYHLFSSDYGQTWSKPSKLSASIGVNQGAEVAVNGSALVATWRRVKDGNEPDSIMFARSTDGGETWSKAGVLSLGQFFDQDTSELQFRTRSMPTIAHDGRAFHVFWAARGFVAGFPGDARTVVSSSRDGSTWTPPRLVDSSTHRGHQIMPIAAVAGGRIQVNWLDTRNNDPATFGPSISDVVTDQCPAGDTTPTSGAAITQCVYRQSADVYAAQSPSADSSVDPPTLAFSDPKAISRYRVALVAPGVRQQVEHNFVNARLFRQGTLPFHGDYHAVASQRYRPAPDSPGQWIRNTAPSTSNAVFYSAFTDNREVKGYVWAGPTNTTYTPQTTMEGESGTDLVTPCVASPQTGPDLTVATRDDNTRSRYQNIYAATSFPGLIVASPSGSKPSGALERAYAIFVQNLTSQDRTYILAVANQPAGGRASWRSDDPSVPATSCDGGSLACHSITTTIPRGSSITRTVYVKSVPTDPRPRIVVNVCELVAAGCGQTGSAILNANPDAADIENPDGLPAALDVLSQELYQPDILQRQTTLYYTGLVNNDVVPVTNVATPRIEYPRIEYPRIEYPRIEYPRIEYPRIEYPRIEYPRIEYTAVENPRIEYSPLDSGDVSGAGTVAVTEITWPVTTDSDLSNTTTAMTARIFLNGPPAGLTGAQLLVSVPNFSTTLRSCAGEPETIVENQVVVNIVLSQSQLGSLSPTTGANPDTVNPAFTQPSFFVRYNQVVYVTLRLFGRADLTLANRAGVVVRSQPDTTDDDTLDQAMDGTIDVTPPTVNLGGLSAGLNVEGNVPGGANVNVTVTASDNSGSASVSCVRTSGDTSATLPSDGTASFVPLGSWTVTCTASDAAGNTSSGGFALSVADTTAPTLDVTHLDITATPAPGGATIAYDVTQVTAHDAVDTTPTVTCVPPSGTFVPVGSATVTCTAVDHTGNTATASYTFTVSDKTPPAIGSHADVTAEATSAAGAAVSYTSPATQDDVDAAVTATCSPASGSTVALGDTTVTCNASDAAGNAATPTTFVVHVIDTTAPAIEPHAKVTAEATSAAGAAVTYTSPATADAVDGAGLATCTPASGTTFALGNTTVTCGATDAHGNAATATSFTVAVVDTRPPVVTVPANITTQATSPSGAVVTFVASALDAVSGVTAVSCLPASGTTFVITTTTVTCSSTDAAGNRGSASFTVTIVTPSAPSVTAAASPTTLLWSPNKTMTPVTISGVATGSGLTTVSYTVKDEYGKVQPSGNATVDGVGTYSFVVKLEAYRNGSDADGRRYTITVKTTDSFGRSAAATATVWVPHDRQ